MKRLTDNQLFESIDELEQWCEDTGKTVQFTFRVKSTPRWCVRIGRCHSVKGEINNRQAVDEDLGTAFVAAYDAFLIDEEADEGGRKSTTQVE